MTCVPVLLPFFDALSLHSSCYLNLAPPRPTSGRHHPYYTLLYAPGPFQVACVPTAEPVAFVPSL